ncbi:MAG: ATP-binding protein [Thiobacillaceae bacterium]|nr:ATP-binding protein [Thiobacillaceae bacterium]MDW8322903.1 ATP-binding protein [Burkholderiales bacterium]
MVYLIAGGLILGAALIALLSAAAENTELFAQNYPLLLFVNAAAVGVLILLVGYQVLLLRRRIRAGMFGAKLTARLIRMFALMALGPGLVVYGVSVQFLIKSIESWFDVRMERALEGGLSLGQAALEYLERDLIRKAETLADRLSEQPAALQLERLDELRESAGVQEAALFGTDGRLLAYASADKGTLAPPVLDQRALWQVRLLQPWSQVDSMGEHALIVRVAAPVSVASPVTPLRVLQIAQPVPGALAQAALQVEAARSQYQELAVSRVGLKRLYGLSLTLVLAIALFTAIALAFMLSQRLAAPLRVLARGTRAVARGDYSQVQAIASRDELGMLTQSFNRMTQQLAEARAAAEAYQDELLAAKAYLEGVLARLTTGVVTLDAQLNVRIVNPAAAAILGQERQALEERPLASWGEEASPLRALALAIREHFERMPHTSWQGQWEYARGESVRVLILRGAPLTAQEAPDYTLVIDDITQLVQAQRDAAWGEVARRLAHEIKNPLTPIQLSAERLQVKLADRLDEAGRQTLRRATDTIINQVAALKGLVDAFSQYAKLPVARIERLDLNALIREVAVLYEEIRTPVLDLAADLPPVAGDPALLRQLLHNLLKNAHEALVDVREPEIRVSTRRVEAGVELCVADNGPGFPEQLFSRLFEPYATTKAKGTGLGLAVVRKIVEEHHGTIEVRNQPGGGAQVCVTLPVLEQKA